MAVDTREKRASVLGVGRPWMRDKLPDATASAPWRAATGNVYNGNAFAAIIPLERHRAAFNLVPLALLAGAQIDASLIRTAGTDDVELLQGGCSVTIHGPLV